jgi:hypothetical protein
VARGDVGQVEDVCTRVVRAIAQYRAANDNVDNGNILPTSSPLPSSPQRSQPIVPPLSLPINEPVSSRSHGYGHDSNSNERPTMDQRLQAYDRELLLKHEAMIDGFEDEVRTYRDRVLADEQRKRHIELQQPSLDVAQRAKLEK